MPRALSVSRVIVAAANESEYLRTVARLAGILERRGQRLWVFRSPDRPGTFLEFNESPSPMSHRSRASRTGDELSLEMKLQTLASYASDAWDLWEEIPLHPQPEPSGGE